MLHADVWSWLPDGEVRRLSGGNGAWMQACVHPDGAHAVFWGGTEQDAPRLWRAPTDVGSMEPLTESRSGARHGAFGLRGDRIAFVSDRASGRQPGRMADESPAGTPPAGSLWHVFTMDLDGGDVRQVTDGPHIDQRPALSPDGSTIAFISDRGGGIWLVPVDGGAAPQQVRADLFLYRPWWAPDGRALYTFLITPDRRQVGRLDLDTQSFELLANDDRGNTHGPFVDPHGDRLIVHSDRDGRWGLHELPLDGAPMRPLLPPGHEDRICAHGTRARNGVLTFDEAAMTELTRA